MKIIVTLGPSTRTEEDLRKIKDKGIDFVRINMSHSSLDDLRYFIALSKKVGIPFIVDTEGSQIRTGKLKNDSCYFTEGSEVKLTNKDIVGDIMEISIRPPEILSQLEKGDILYCDFDSLILRIHETKTASKGYVVTQVLSSGTLGSNKGVAVHSALPNKQYNLPPLSPKDYAAIKIGLKEGAKHIAASFMRSGQSVDEVRRATKKKMKIISKIECIDGLNNLKDIIKKSDHLLIDRGDLSKEISIEKIPLTQKMIINEAKKAKKGVYVATNLLETMIEKPKPTRAEIHDIEQTILDGAYGITLAAETAIGKYPFECINTFNRIIQHVEEYTSAKSLDSLVSPHGGALIDGLIEKPDEQTLSSLPHIAVSDEQFMDAEQIALGTFSPLTGFMRKIDVLSVLNTMRLKNGIVWPLPIVLDVSKDDAEPLRKGDTVVLTDKTGKSFGVLHLKEKYSIDKKEYAHKLYGTTSEIHPGVQAVSDMHPIFLSGDIEVFMRRPSSYKGYEITPRQARRIFEERGWRTVVGFHTRNAPHRGHEFIQLEALRKAYADGLFIHPVTGKKQTGDFQPAPIIKSYEFMMRNFYPKGKVVFGTYATFSRYAGPREALFTALCRKNFGCSHFVIGRDHTGVGDFYSPKASHDIFDTFPDLGITPVLFDKVFYSREKKKHVHEAEDTFGHKEKDKLHISGTQARNMLLKGRTLPGWFMRPEISKLLIEMVKKGEEVFVP